MKYTLRRKARYKKRRKTRKYKQKGGAGDDCPICFEPLNERATITTSCNHTFHASCIKETCEKMYRNKRKQCICPLCRKDIDGDIPKKIVAEPKYDPNHITAATFTYYINDLLYESPSVDPEEILDEIMKSYHDENNFEFDNDIYWKIMEFEKIHVFTTIDRVPLYIYKFNGFVDQVPLRHRISVFSNHKYYNFEMDDDGITDVSEIE